MKSESPAFDLERFKKESDELIEEMKQIKPDALTEQKLWVKFLKKFPLIENLMENLGLNNEAISQFADTFTPLSSSLQTASGGIHIGLTALGAGSNFFLIPIIFLIAGLTGEKAPITLSNGAKWVYSAIVLSLVVVAFVIPAIAPPIALATASLGMMISLFSIGKISLERYNLNKELNFIKEYEAKREQFEEDLKKTEESNLSPQNIKRLQEKRNYLNENKEKYKELKKKENELKYRKENQVGYGKIMDKGVGVLISALVLTGLTLALFFPPVGFGIILGAGALGLTYAIARISYPLVKKLASKLFKKVDSVPAIMAETNDKSIQEVLKDDNLPPSDTLTDPLIHESTDDLDSTTTINLMLTASAHEEYAQHELSDNSNSVLVDTSDPASPATSLINKMSEAENKDQEDDQESEGDGEAQTYHR